MIDPVLSLCFGLHSTPGVYALLLGSGISRAARIPTGWEIISDLIRKVAHLQAENCEPDPCTWYKKVFKKEPSYSELINHIAKTQVERQQLLKAYFEPTEEEREEGAKQPTAAHKSIANLVVGGYIRVIITTNFDRLLETALEDIGVVPTVIKAPDDVEGALPLIHSRCTIIKVHGDYIDTRIKNTVEELSRYDKNTNKLLDKVFDEFGLIVCGWSADWDEALRKAMTRFKNRRFTMFWASYGELSANAIDLVTHRSGKVIPIDSADNFFTNIMEKTAALAQFDQPHPLSAQLAVTTVKKYLSEGKYLIRLHDVLTEEASRAYSEINSSFFSPQTTYSTDTMKSRMDRYEAAVNILLQMAVQVAFWGKPEHFTILLTVFKIITTPTKPTGGDVEYLKLQHYPAALLFYGIAIALISTSKFVFLNSLLNAKITNYSSKENISAVNLYIYDILDPDLLNEVLGTRHDQAPQSLLVFKTLREAFRNVLPVDHDYAFNFDTCEYLLALLNIYTVDYRNFTGRDWAVIGAVYHRRNNFNSIQKHLDLVQQDTPLLQAGFLDGSWEQFRETHDRLKDITYRCP